MTQHPDVTTFIEDCEGLIDVLKWYRDEYHRNDWCHSEYIQTLEQHVAQASQANAVSPEARREYQSLEDQVDRWID